MRFVNSFPRRDLLHRLAQPFKTWLLDRKGGSGLVFSLMTPLMLAGSGLAIDAVHWNVSHDKLQAATDQAAISAAHVLYQGHDAATVDSAARLHLARIYTNSASSLNITVNAPPASGSSAGDKQAVEVIVGRKLPSYFVRLFGIEEMPIRTRSASKYNGNGEHCVLALNQTLDKAVNITGSINADLGCGIASNSSSSEAVFIGGSAQVTSPNVSAVGDIFIKSTSQLNDGQALLRPSSPAIIDPYGPDGRNLQVPSLPANCKERNAHFNRDAELQPGRYCGGIQINGGNISFKPGTYIIDKGEFKVNGNASLSGTGVTFILTGSGNQYANLSINGGASLSLYAPVSGTDHDGVLFFQDPAAPSYQGAKLNTNKINGAADMALSGAVYFPSQQLELTGGASGNTRCLQLIGQSVKLSGDARITNICEPTDGTERITLMRMKLVE